MTQILSKNGISDVSSKLLMYTVRKFGQIEQLGKEGKPKGTVSESTLRRMFNNRKFVAEDDNDD